MTWQAQLTCLIVYYDAFRIRFMMWTSNDYLPGFEGVGWKTANKLHKEYEDISDESNKVCTGTCSYVYNACVLVSHSPSLNMFAV